MATSSKNTNNSSGGFFAALFGSNDPEAQKKRALRILAKDISKARYKFYKTSTNQVLPSLAKYFYEIYKVIAPSQAIFQNKQAIQTFKSAIINYSLSDRQRECLENLSDDALIAAANNMSVADLSKRVKKDLSDFTSDFTTQRMGTIDALYSMTTAFISFCSFDFFMFLKKFDPGFQERDFKKTPTFQTIRADFITEDLKDFIIVAWPLQSKEAWGKMLEFLKEYKQIETIQLNPWTRVVNRISELRSSRILEMIIAYSASTPEYAPVIKITKEKIVDSYIEKVRSQAESTLRKIEKEKASNKSDMLLKSIFGKTEINSLKSYTESSNEYLSKRSLPMFKFCAPANYLKAFLMDYFKKDVREVADLVLIRGKWADIEQSQRMSDSFHNLMELGSKIVAMDEAAGEYIASGNKIKNMIGGKDINTEARNLITQGAQNIVAFAKYLKLLIEDYDRPKPEVMGNWKEVEHAADQNIKKMMITVYKQLFNFVSLMQLYMGSSKAV
ncbi:MAG: hypothetical protein MJ196_12225 [Treponemataceae bacterium]|nr:hypothetical protein [Treponemataceae bacterium]